MSKADPAESGSNQRIVDAPHGGRNDAVDIVVDATESTGQGNAWESSGDLTPENADETGVEGYDSGPGTFESREDGAGRE